MPEHKYSELTHLVCCLSFIIDYCLYRAVNLLGCVQVGDEGRGVAAISHMLTISRLHNIIMSVSAMRRSDLSIMTSLILQVI